MDPVRISLMSLIVGSCNMIIIAITALILRRQVKSNHEWNRRKATQETLEKLVIGEFPILRNKLEVGYGCKIWDKNESYSGSVASKSEEEKREFDALLAQILNIFETIGINIKNNVVDEDICYDYLGWLHTEYHRWSKDFIEERRSRAGDPRILINFTNGAEIWRKRMEEERKDIGRKISLPGGERL